MTSATAGGNVDIWRQTFLRYAGYANEVGEAFAPIFPRFLVPSYAISIAYVLGDTTDKTKAAYDSQRLTGNMNFKKVAGEAADVLTWQMLASVILPGLTIKALTKTLTAAVNSKVAEKTLHSGIKRFGPTACGLAAIPFIIHPIDHAVDHFMHDIFRPHVLSHIIDRKP